MSEEIFKIDENFKINIDGYIFMELSCRPLPMMAWEKLYPDKIFGKEIDLCPDFNFSLLDI